MAPKLSELHDMLTMPFSVQDLEGGSTQLFSGRYVQPRFPNLGACERINCQESGGL